MNNQPFEPARISLEQNYEIRYWTKKLKCTKEELYRAVRKVGACVSSVKKELLR
jgi:hypothetical protein